MKIYEAKDEDVYGDPAEFFTNPHTAMKYIDDTYQQDLSWYQITPRWWRGNNARTGETFSVVEYDLHE